MTDTLIHTVTPELLAEVLKAAGYRVTSAEQNGVPQLLSASQGVGFTIRFGNAAGEPNHYIDYLLGCALQVQGVLPAAVVPEWNSTKRFSRLSLHGQFLMLEMDVVVAGGVAELHLRSMIELWDRLIQEFLLHLRRHPAESAAVNDAAQATHATQATQAAQAAHESQAAPSRKADSTAEAVES